MEPVFAGIFGVLVGGDELGARTMIGAALVLTAMYVVELSPRRRKARPVERLES
jgi:drug/metabolite transporter (DMT)-like permease